MSVLEPPDLWRTTVSGEVFECFGSAVLFDLLKFLEIRRVDRSVHLRFLPAQRLHGNFLSHLVFVFAQLLQAIGVLPADLGIIPSLEGKPSWLF